MTRWTVRYASLAILLLAYVYPPPAFSAMDPFANIAMTGTDNASCGSYDYVVSGGASMLFCDGNPEPIPPWDQCMGGGSIFNIWVDESHRHCFSTWNAPTMCNNQWYQGWSALQDFVDMCAPDGLPSPSYPDPACPPLQSCMGVMQMAYSEVMATHNGAHFGVGCEDVTVDFSGPVTIKASTEDTSDYYGCGGGVCRNKSKTYLVSVPAGRTFAVTARVVGNMGGGFDWGSKTETATAPATDNTCALAEPSLGSTSDDDEEGGGGAGGGGRKPPPNEHCSIGSSVNYASGNLFDTFPLLSIPGYGPPVDFVLAYNSADGEAGSLGPGWRHSYSLKVTQETYGLLMLTEKDGRRIVFRETSPGMYEPYSRYGRAGSTLQKFTDGTYELTRKSGTRHAFDASGRLMRITDRYGNALVLGYVGDDLVSLTDDSGRATLLGYDASHRLTSVTDPAERTAALTYTPGGLLETVTDQAGGVASFVYNGYGILAEKFDRAGNHTTYAYDNAGRLAVVWDNTGTPAFVTYQPDVDQAQVQDRNGGWTTVFYDRVLDAPLRKIAADNGVTTYGYDDARNLLWVVDPAGDNTSYTYDAAGNNTSVIDALGHTTLYTHNGFGQVTSVTDPEVHTTLYGYDSYGNLTSVTDAEDATTTYTYDARGILFSVERPGEGTTEFGYDAYGNRTSVTDPNDLFTSFAYDNVGNMTHRIDPAGGTTVYAYDNLNRLVRVTDPVLAVSSYGYDGNGNRTSVIDGNGNTTTVTYTERNVARTVTDPLGHATSYEYTFGGCSSCGSGGSLPASVTDANGHVVSYEYDLMGRQTAVIDPLGSVTSFGYDILGNRVSATDANGRQTSYYYDALSRPVAEIDPLGAQADFAYSPAGRLDNVTDAIGVATSYAYDNTGRVIAVVSPDAGTTSYAYNGNGTLAQKTDGTGTTVAFVYDNAARLLRMAFPDPAQDVFFGYDSPTSTFGVGRLTSMTDPSGTTVYQYDAAGRLTREEQTIFGVLYATRYAWDNVGNLVSVTYPGGRTVTYAYDALSRPISVTAPINGTAVSLASGIAYDNVGNLLALPLGNGLAETRTFDAANRVTTIAVPGILEQSLAYDNVGNVVSWGENVTPATSPALGTAVYGYVGNRLDNVVEGGYPRIYAYDNTGHPATDGLNEFVYNQNRRLFQVRSGATVLGEYTYDGKGRRVIKYASGATTIFHYDLSGRLIEETDAAGNLLVDYVYLEGRPLAMVRKTGPTEATYYYHDDHLGTPKAMTNQSRTVVWKVPFDPFGNELPGGVKSIENNLRFPGQYFDAESGLHYNYFRDFHPRTGRYIEPDPIGLGPDNINLYTYANNNALRFTDPFGLTVYYCYGRIRTYTHAYVCADKQCAGLMPFSAFSLIYGEGIVLPETFNASQCKEIGVGGCCDKGIFENCVRRKIEGSLYKKHFYGILTYNCVSWAREVIMSCQEEACKK